MIKFGWIAITVSAIVATVTAIRQFACRTKYAVVEYSGARPYFLGR